MCTQVGPDGSNEGRNMRINFPESWNIIVIIHENGLAKNYGTKKMVSRAWIPLPANEATLLQGFMVIVKKVDDDITDLQRKGNHRDELGLHT